MLAEQDELVPKAARVEAERGAYKKKTDAKKMARLEQLILTQEEEQFKREESKEAAQKEEQLRREGERMRIQQEYNEAEATREAEKGRAVYE